MWKFWPSSGNYNNKLSTSNQIQKNKKKATPVITEARKKNGRKDVNFIHQWVDALVFWWFPWFTLFMMKMLQK